MYSGYRLDFLPFAYGAFTLSGWLSQNHSARIAESIMRSEPRCARTTVCPLSISLAATLEIDVSFSSSPYLDVSVQAVPLIYLLIQYMMTVHDHSRIAPFGNPRILTLTYSSPWLIAVSHVLLRLPVPRHSPCALVSLTIEISFGSSLSNYLLYSQINRLISYLPFSA